MSFLLILLIGLALAFDFLNGFIGSSSIVATVVSSRALSPRQALALVASAEFVGPLLFGTAVALTIGRDLVNVRAIDEAAVVAALGAAISWSLITWHFAWPSSTSHALVGGLVGAALAAHGLSAIHLPGLGKVVLALFLSPVLGVALAFLMLKLLYSGARGATPSINTLFKQLQLVTAVALALSHGTNDAQKVMGVIALSMVIAGYTVEFTVPWWVAVLSAVAISLGTAAGGWRLIKKLGGKFYKIRPIHAFGSQLTSAIIILGAGLLGGPVSSTQVISSSIIGAGAADRISKVRWMVFQEMALAWLLTIPLSALLAAALYLVVGLVV